VLVIFDVRGEIIPLATPAGEMLLKSAAVVLLRGRRFGADCTLVLQHHACGGYRHRIVILLGLVWFLLL